MGDTETGMNMERGKVERRGRKIMWMESCFFKVQLSGNKGS